MAQIRKTDKGRRQQQAALRIRPLEIARRTGHLLMAGDQSLVTAESCTGGLIAEWLTRVAGSSGWFDCGLVTYSNAAKRQLLGVNQATLDQYGAVSEETAGEMAIGALNNSSAGIAVAVTGIAGPDGGSRAKPVGTVCLAWAERAGLVHSARVQLRGDRDSIRRQSAALALYGVQDRLSAE